MNLRTFPRRLVPAWFEAGLIALEAFLEPRPLPETDAVLWAVVIVGAALDVTTTIVGVTAGFPEGGTVARAFMQTYGTPGIGALKLVALVALVVTWHYLESRSAQLVLVGFGLVTLLAAALNALTLAAI